MGPERKTAHQTATDGGDTPLQMNSNVPIGNPKVYFIFFIRVYTYNFRFSNDFQLGKIRKAFLAERPFALLPQNSIDTKSKEYFRATCCF